MNNVNCKNCELEYTCASCIYNNAKEHCDNCGVGYACDSCIYGDNNFKEELED